MADTFWARTDSNTANNPAINLIGITGTPAIQITFVPTGTDGDIILEGGGAPDPDTAVLIDGSTYEFTFEFEGTTPTATSQGAGQLPVALRGSTIMLITVIDYPAPGESTRLAFFPEDEPSEALMNSIGNGRINVNNIDTNGPGVVCFAEGTLLRTPGGDRAVETLRVGDLVSTVDDGPQPIIWIGRTRHAWPGAADSALPVLVSQGALAGGKPERDLVVSPQHKILVKRDHGDQGVLVPVKGLTALPGIRVMRGKKRIEYFHVMLERHSVLLSEGLPSESFYPWPTAVEMLAPAHRLSLMAAIGNGAERYGPTARPCLTVHETRSLANLMRSALAV